MLTIKNKFSYFQKNHKVKGSIFGEIGFFSNAIKYTTAKTEDFVSLYTLKRSEFLEMLYENKYQFDLVFILKIYSNIVLK